MQFVIKRMEVDWEVSSCKTKCIVLPDDANNMIAKLMARQKEKLVKVWKKEVSQEEYMRIKKAYERQEQYYRKHPFPAYRPDENLHPRKFFYVDAAGTLHYEDIHISYSISDVPIDTYANHDWD